MVNAIFGFGKLVQQAGFGRIVKYIPQYADKAGRTGLVVFEDGTRGVYNTLREAGQSLTQSISAGGKRIEYSTKYGKDFYAESIWDGVKEVLIPQTRSKGYIREGAKHTYACDYTRIPLLAKTTKHNGKFRTTVPVVQELHTTKLVNGKALLPEDRLVASNGEFQLIYQRPMKMADRIDFNEAWGVSSFQG